MPERGSLRKNAPNRWSCNSPVEIASAPRTSAGRELGPKAAERTTNVRNLRDYFKFARGLFSKPVKRLAPEYTPVTSQLNPGKQGLRRRRFGTVPPEKFV